MAELGFAVGLLAPCDLWPAMACWGFGIGSGFRGLVHSGVRGGRLVSIFGEFSFSAGGAFILAGGGGGGGGGWALGYHSMGFRQFLHIS